MAGVVEQRLKKPAIVVTSLQLEGLDGTYYTPPTSTQGQVESENARNWCNDGDVELKWLKSPPSTVPHVDREATEDQKAEAAEDQNCFNSLGGIVPNVQASGDIPCSFDAGSHLVNQDPKCRYQVWAYQ
jgi:hypothetical protein